MNAETAAKMSTEALVQLRDHYLQMHVTYVEAGDVEAQNQVLNELRVVLTELNNRAQSEAASV